VLTSPLLDRLRASASLARTEADIDALLEAGRAIARGGEQPLAYEQDPRTGDFAPVSRPAGRRAA
jgi:hypothetical protein